MASHGFPLLSFLQRIHSEVRNARIESLLQTLRQHGPMLHRPVDSFMQGGLVLLPSSIVFQARVHVEVRVFMLIWEMPYTFPYLYADFVCKRISGCMVSWLLC